MTEQQPKQKKALVKLPFPMPNESNQADDAVHNQVRPKPEQYADRTWMLHVVRVVLWENANF